MERRQGWCGSYINQQHQFLFLCFVFSDTLVEDGHSTTFRRTPGLARKSFAFSFTSSLSSEALCCTRGMLLLRQHQKKLYSTFKITNKLVCLAALALWMPCIFFLKSWISVEAKPSWLQEFTYSTNVQHNWKQQAKDICYNNWSSSRVEWQNCRSLWLFCGHS